MVSDMTNGGRDLGIVNGQYVAGLPGCYSDRFDQLFLLIGRGTGHQLGEKRSRFVTDALRIGGNAGKRRIAQLAQHFIVVHSDYGRFVRNANAASLAGVQYLLTADVAARHDAKRFTQRPQPAADDFLFFFPGGRVGTAPGGFINLARKASGAHPLRESIGALLRPFVSGKSAECELLKTAIQEMFGPQLAYHSMVGLYRGQAVGRVNVIDVDHGNPDAAKVVGEFLAH